MTTQFEPVWAQHHVPVNKANPNEYQWATYIKDRRPQFKIHRTLGHAHAALTWRGTRITNNMALYQLQGEDWVVQHEWTAGTAVTHFPWQALPLTSEQIQAERNKREWEGLKSHIATFIGSQPDDEFHGLLAELRRYLVIIENHRWETS